MGSSIENNLFANYVFAVASGQTNSSLRHQDGSGTFPANYQENPRLCLVGLFMPAGLTSTAIAIETSHDGITWLPVYDAAGAAYGLTVAPSRYVAIPPSVSIGWGYIRLVCGTAEGGARSIIGRFQAV